MLTERTWMIVLSWQKQVIKKSFRERKKIMNQIIIVHI